MIIGTAGHVDHGKTSLVRALTGVDTDRLAEEKARGISIELGFAYARFGDATDDDAAEPVGFIDVPGHRRFVQTMIAGAAGVDLGLLVVAADDGPMPQTVEHVAILRWLGVPDLVVALTKVDLVDAARVAAATTEIAALLASTAWADAPIVPVSVATTTGLDRLRHALLAHRHARAERDDASHFRLAIDRAFNLRGIGLVVTGTCFAGSVAIDDVLTLLPGGLTARVRGIHAQDLPVERAQAGQRVALNVVGRGVEKSAVTRGMWIVAPAIAIQADRIDVALSNAAASLFDTRAWGGVRFHCGATSCNARVVRLSDDDPSLAQVALEHPVHVLAGDRFVLRDANGADDTSGSVAGGVVLDIDVPTRGRRGVERLRLLTVAASGDARATLAQAIADSAKGIALGRWNATHGTTFDAADIDAEAVGNETVGITLFSRGRWDELRTRVVDILAAEHARAPDAVGPGRDRLRRMAAPSASASTWTALIDGLKEGGRIAQTGAWLHLPAHRVELSIEDRARCERVRPLLADPATAKNPPRVRDVARILGEDEALIRSLFVRLASLGQLYRIAHDHYYLPDAVRELADDVGAVAATDGVAKAASFRDRTGVGRKVAIQILEFFDRVGFTRRVGDDHRVIQPSLFDGS